MNDPLTGKRGDQCRDLSIQKEDEEDASDVSFRGEQDDEEGSEDNYSDSSFDDDEEEDEDDEYSESFQEEGCLNTKASAADGTGTLPTRMSSSSTTDYNNRSGRRSRRPLHHKNSNNNTIEVDNLAGNVADKLLHWRIVFLWILVSCGVAVSIGTYYVMERQTNLLLQQQAVRVVFCIIVTAKEVAGWSYDTCAILIKEKFQKDPTDK